MFPRNDKVHTDVDISCYFLCKIIQNRATLLEESETVPEALSRLQTGTNPPSGLCFVDGNPVKVLWLDVPRGALLNQL